MATSRARASGRAFQKSHPQLDCYIVVFESSDREKLVYHIHVQFCRHATSVKRDSALPESTEKGKHDKGGEPSTSNPKP